MNPNDAGGWGDKDGMNDKKRNRIDYTQTTQYVRMKRKHVLANIQQEGWIQRSKLDRNETVWVSCQKNKTDLGRIGATEASKTCVQNGIVKDMRGKNEKKKQRTEEGTDGEWSLNEPWNR